MTNKRYQTSMFIGTFRGKASAEHGFHRSEQFIIATDTGGMIYTNEAIDDLQVGDRVTFEHAIAENCELVASRIRSIKRKLAEPLASETPKPSSPGAGDTAVARRRARS